MSLFLPCPSDTYCPINSCISPQNTNEAPSLKQGLTLKDYVRIQRGARQVLEVTEALPKRNSLANRRWIKKSLSSLDQQFSQATANLSSLDDQNSAQALNRTLVSCRNFANKMLKNHPLGPLVRFSPPVSFKDSGSSAPLKEDRTSSLPDKMENPRPMEETQMGSHIDSTQEPFSDPTFPKTPQGFEWYCLEIYKGCAKASLHNLASDFFEKEMLPSLQNQLASLFFCLEEAIDEVAEIHDYSPSLCLQTIQKTMSHTFFSQAQRLFTHSDSPEFPEEQIMHIRQKWSELQHFSSSESFKEKVLNSCAQDLFDLFQELEKKGLT